MELQDHDGHEFNKSLDYNEFKIDLEEAGNEINKKLSF